MGSGSENIAQANKEKLDRKEETKKETKSDSQQRQNERRSDLNTERELEIKTVKFFEDESHQTLRKLI
jgi:hypothetical protein